MKGWKTFALGALGIIGGAALAIYVPEARDLGYKFAYWGAGFITLRLGIKATEQKINLLVDSLIDKAEKKLKK